MSRFSEPMTASKSMRYNTRRLVAGEGFMASPKDVRILEAIGKAKRGRPAADLSAPPATLVAKIAAFDGDGNGEPGGSAKPAPDPDLASVRAEYVEKMGKRPFPGWDVAELRRRMANA